MNPAIERIDREINKNYKELLESLINDQKSTNRSLLLNLILIIINMSCLLWMLPAGLSILLAGLFVFGITLILFNIRTDCEYLREREDVLFANLFEKLSPNLDVPGMKQLFIDLSVVTDVWLDRSAKLFSCGIGMLILAGPVAFILGPAMAVMPTVIGLALIWHASKAGKIARGRLDRIDAILES